MKTKKEVFAAGIRRGLGFSLYADIPAKGRKHPAAPTLDEAKEIFIERLGDNETIDRDFTPFEFTAHALNVLDGDDKTKFDPWVVFEDGIFTGFKRGMRKRLTRKTFGKDLKEI